jgi:hypothetical protein
VCWRTDCHVKAENNAPKGWAQNPVLFFPPKPWKTITLEKNCSAVGKDYQTEAQEADVYGQAISQQAALAA